jgi:hypothetical protein
VLEAGEEVALLDAAVGPPVEGGYAIARLSSPVPGAVKRQECGALELLG